MPTAIGYLRESTLQSEDEQLDAIDAYHERVLAPNGVELDEFCFSDPPERRRWRFRQRDGAWGAIRECERGDSIIVVSLANAFRNHDDFVDAQELLAKRGIELHIAQADSAALIHEAGARVEMLAELAHAETQRAREVAVERYKKCRQQGKAIGRAPLGKKWAGPFGRRRLVDDKHDQGVMKLISELSARGNSLDAIFFFLLAKGIRRSSGREWARTTIWNVVCQRQNFPIHSEPKHATS